MNIYIKDKHFGDKIIFSDFSLDLPEGKVSVIKSPSGRGKTTLLRIMLSLDKDYEGVIIDPPKFPVVVFQEDRLVESLSVRANLKAVSNDMEKASILIDKLGLSGEMDRKISELSGGMKRRVAIARAFLLDFDWLLLDEPFKGLDESTKKMTAGVILDFSKNKSIILITHDDSDAALMGGTINRI